MKFFLLLGVLTLSFLALGTANAYAVTFTVDTDVNGTDSVPGDGFCDTGSAECTLHAAIEEANALAGADTIEFNIPGGGVRTITPTIDLPDITENILIDGESQPGSVCGTLVPTNKVSNTPHTLLIEIDASQITSSVLRLESQSEDSTLRGLVINSVQNNMAALEMTSVNNLSNTTVECNYLGTDSSGYTAPANSGTGIFANDSMEHSFIRNNLISGNSYSTGLSIGGGDNQISGNLIGTTADGSSALGNARGVTLTYYNTLVENNVISGNDGAGIYMSENGTNTVTANYIGLGLDGQPLGNSGPGIHLLNSWSNSIGGSSATESNAISANQSDGILMENDCSLSGAFENIVTGNMIGADANGQFSSNTGNTGAGIRISAYNGPCTPALNNQIGGTEADQGNVIAGNTEQGVILHQEPGASIFGTSIIGNSIFSNGGMSIDLAADSIIDGLGTANADVGLNSINNLDMSFPSTVSNNYINYPTINSATTTNGQLRINYNFVANSVLDSPPELQESDLVGFRLDFYLNNSSDILGSGQSETHLGYFIVDGSENSAEHTFTTNFDIDDAQRISATATALWADKGSTNPCDDVSIFGVAPPYALATCGG